jgi:hypothetical protein
VTYPPATSPELLQRALGRGSLQSAGLSEAALTSFIGHSKAVVLRGKGLYPRFYQANTGEASTMALSFKPTGYPRLIFHLVGPVTAWVLLPAETSPSRFENARDVTVFGCLAGPDVIARVVLVEGSPDAVYQQTPPAPLSCP